jgi:hypothetical protein
MSNPNVKVVLASKTLAGGSHDSLQKVATVYVDGAEYRVYAPEHAKGSAEGWIAHFMVRQQSGANAESEVPNVLRDLCMRTVTEALKQQNQDARRQMGMHPDGMHCTAQICKQGHIQHCNGLPFSEGAHCTTCGSKCIDECMHCQEPIRGADAYGSTFDYVRPQFCHGCGQPYPWMEERLRVARELLDEDDKLSEEDRQSLWGDLQYVMSNPKADLAPAKRKLIDIKLAPATGWIRDAVIDLLAKTAAEMAKP